MDNYRKKQSQPGRYRSTSIDGFFQSGATRQGGPNTGRQPVFGDRLRERMQTPPTNGPQLSSQSQLEQARLEEMRRRKQLAARQAAAAEARRREELTQRNAPRRPQDEGVKKRNAKSNVPPKPKFGFSKKARAARKEWRKARNAARPKWKRWLIRIGIILAIAAIVLAGFLAFKGYLKLRDIFQGGGYSAALDGNADPNKLKGEGDGRINILMIGGRADNDPDGGGLTDTILVMSIDPVNNKSALLSIPRDLWVRTNDYGSTKINAVYKFAHEDALEDGKNEKDASLAGARALQTEITDVLGVNMHYYAMVNIDGFVKAVDTLGGVPVNVPEDLRDPSMAWKNGGRSLLVPAGQQKLDSKRSLFYVQSRYGSARGDFDRSERQRIFIAALMKEMTSAGTFGNPATVSRLMDNFGDSIKTDFSLNELMRLYELSKKMGDPASIELVGEGENGLLTTDMVSGQSVVVPKAGTFEYEAVQLYLRKMLPDGYIIKENARITVLNGSGIAGLATEKADELKSYRYNVVNADTAPTSDYQKTIIVDSTEGDAGKYTRNYLEKRFGVKATRELPAGITAPTQPGFVIILGSN